MFLNYTGIKEIMETEESEMTNRKRRLGIFMVVLLVVGLLATSLASAAEPSKEFDDLEDRIDYMRIMIQFIQAKYKYDVTEEELMEGAYSGIFESLDEHSVYFSPDEYDRFNQQAQGEYEGIGIHITKRGDHTVVITPMEGSPAEKAGIMAGDIIRFVDGEDITGYSLDKAASLIKGEGGTLVNIGIIKDGATEPVYYDIAREKITIVAISSEILEGDIGYIKITSFSKGTSDEFKDILLDFESRGVKGIIVDVRNNPGGLVTEVLEIADRFIAIGEAVLYTDYKDGKRSSYVSAWKPVGLPLAILINEGSASASEILAGSVKDTGAGIVVGTRSFGKGTVQSVTPITNGGAIKLTIAEYLTAGQNPIDKVGIEPDFVVANPDSVHLEAISDFVPMIEADKPGLGDMGLNVYGAQQRLAFLGYDVNATGKLDEDTFRAIQSFQENAGLYAYGVLDWTTRDRIMEKVRTVFETGVEDLQLQTAIEKITEQIK